MGYWVQCPLHRRGPSPASTALASPSLRFVPPAHTACCGSSGQRGKRKRSRSPPNSLERRGPLSGFPPEKWLLLGVSGACGTATAAASCPAGASWQGRGGEGRGEERIPRCLPAPSGSRGPLFKKEGFSRSHFCPAPCAALRCGLEARTKDGGGKPFIPAAAAIRQALCPFPVLPLSRAVQSPQVRSLHSAQSSSLPSAEGRPAAGPPRLAGTRADLFSLFRGREGREKVSLGGKWIFFRNQRTV